MSKWHLIISLSMVSFTILMFISAYLSIPKEAASYYNKSIADIAYLSNIFNICYLLVCPFLLMVFKKRLYFIVQFAIILIAVGCVGRYIAGGNYQLAKIFTILVAVAHIPIIAAPFGLLGLFQPSKRAYAASILLFVPPLGIYLVQLYGLHYIAGQAPDNGERDKQISQLNSIITFLSIITCSVVLALMKKFRKDIISINENSQQNRYSRSSIQSFKNQFKPLKQFIIISISWGLILGFNWTYGGMLNEFLDQTGLSHELNAFVGILAIIGSAIFSILANLLSYKLNFPNSLIIFYINIVAFIASLWMQLSNTLPQSFFHDMGAQAVFISIFRVGCSSFLPLAFNELNQYGAPILVSSILFYFANIGHFLANNIIATFNMSKSLGIITIFIWICIVLVHNNYKQKIAFSTEPLELSTYESAKKGEIFEQQIEQKKDKQFNQEQQQQKL